MASLLNIQLLYLAAGAVLMRASSSTLQDRVKHSLGVRLDVLTAVVLHLVHKCDRLGSVFSTRVRDLAELVGGIYLGLGQDVEGQ